MNKRFYYKNPEVLNEFYAQGRSVGFAFGHYGNWEWTVSLPKLIKYQVNVIYRPIQDETI